MGHDLPDKLLERFAQSIADNAARACTGPHGPVGSQIPQPVNAPPAFDSDRLCLNTMWVLTEPQKKSELRKSVRRYRLLSRSLRCCCPHAYKVEVGACNALIVGPHLERRRARERKRLDVDQGQQARVSRFVERNDVDDEFFIGCVARQHARHPVGTLDLLHAVQNIAQQAARNRSVDQRCSLSKPKATRVSALAMVSL